MRKSNRCAQRASKKKAGGTAQSSMTANRSCPSTRRANAKEAASPNPRRKNCCLHSSSTRTRSYALQSAARCRSPTVVASSVLEWRESSRNNLEPFETSLMLKSAAVFSATCSRCPAKATTRLLRCKSHSTAMQWKCSTKPN